MKFKVAIECNADEIFVQAIGFRRAEIAHQGNKGEVCNYLIRSNVLVGLIDEDPGSAQPKSLHMNYVCEEEKFGVRVWRKENYLINSVEK